MFLERNLGVREVSIYRKYVLLVILLAAVSAVPPVRAGVETVSRIYVPGECRPRELSKTKLLTHLLVENYPNL